MSNGLQKSKGNPNAPYNVKNTCTKIHCVLRRNLSVLYNFAPLFSEFFNKNTLQKSFSEPLLQYWEPSALSCLLVIIGVSQVIRFPLSYLLSSCPQYNDNHRDLNAKAAWQLGYTGKGVVVSILDDGIERKHPDLSQNYVSEKKTHISEEDLLSPLPSDRFLLVCTWRFWYFQRCWD